MDLSTSRLATVNQSSPVVHGLTDSNFGRSLLLNFENYYEIQIVDGFSSAKKTLGSCATMSFIDSTKGLGWELSFTPYSFNSFCALDSSIHSLSIIFLLLLLSVIYGSSSYSLLFYYSTMAVATAAKHKKRPKRNEAHIPMWWMQVTPHNTLDREDEHTRRLFEEKMALWYAEQAAQEATEGTLMLDIDGNPLSPEEAERVRETGHGGWKSEWGPNTNNDNNNDNNGNHSILFGGRNCQPGSPGWNPRQWGIDQHDPDFALYQSGDKLPQEYIDAMTNYAKATGKYQSPDYGSGLRSTEGKGYGELGATPAHVPSWMKKKLRSTNQGASIRQGQYDDSPNKHLKAGYERRVEEQEPTKNFLHAPTPTAKNITTSNAPEPTDDDDEEDDAGAAVGHVAPEPKTFASHKYVFYWHSWHWLGLI